MRAFVTGATGFIGGHLAAKLRGRGDDVVALVRSPEKDLRALGCELVEGDLGDAEAIWRAVEGADAAFHLAAVYKVGIPVRDRPAMEEANVGGTERVLDQATAAGVARIVYLSTVNVFGNTRGQVVDETFQRTDLDWLSWYDKTKYEAHQVAVDRITKGAPVLIAQPGGVYGPGDTFEAATMVRQMAMGRFRMKMFPDTGLNMAHVDDIADGILLVHDKGNIGETYVIGGDITTLGEIIAKMAALAGKKPPRVTLPAWMAKSAIPIAPLVTKAMGFPPNLRELIKTSDGVTYWATDAKARRELGYSPRGLDTGLRQMLEAEGTLAT